jgi:hypothetical protein
MGLENIRFQSDTTLAARPVETPPQSRLVDQPGSERPDLRSRLLGAALGTATAVALWGWWLLAAFSTSESAPTRFDDKQS